MTTRSASPSSLDWLSRFPINQYIWCGYIRLGMGTDQLNQHTPERFGM